MNLLHLALRQWRQRPARTVLSILSIAIAVAAVLGTRCAQMSVRESYRHLARTVEGEPSLDIMAVAGGRFAVADVSALTDLPGVKATIPLVSRATSARVGGRRLRLLMLGLPLERKAAWDCLQFTFGRACQKDDEAVVAAEVVGNRSELLGSRIIVMTRRGPRSATVVGLATSASLQEFANGATTVFPLQTLQSFFGLDGQVDRMRVLINGEQDRAVTEAAIAARLPDDLLVQRPVGKMVLADSILRSSELALQFAGALSVAMAAFLILNTLRMNFGERRRDLATVRVLGGTAGQVAGFHLFEGAALGLVGSILGVPLGILVGRGLTNGIERLIAADIAEPQTPMAAVLFALAVGPLVAALAALIPALQSRRVSPLEAMGEAELRRADRFPTRAVLAGVVAWCLAVTLIILVALERLSPELTIPAGLLMLVAFIVVIPAVLQPVVRGASAVLSPLLRMEGSLAAEQILRRSTRTCLTVGVLVVAISNGLGLGNAVLNNVNDVRVWYRKSMSGDVFLINAQYDPASADQARVGERIRQLPGVDHVVELRYLPMNADGLPATCLVRNFVPQAEMPWSLPVGTEDDLRARLLQGQIVLSNVLARKLKIQPGDRVRVELQGRVFSLPVAALVNDYTLGGMAGFLDASVAANMVDTGHPYIFVVKATDVAQTPALVSALETLGLELGMVVQSFAQMRQQLDLVIDGVVGALWALLAVGFAVGGIAVGNTLTMSVLEQTRELGLLRIVGMTRRQIRRLVFCESLLVGIVGGSMGILAGVTTAWIIHLCNQPLLGYSIPFTFHFWLLVANAGGCLVVALVASWSPANRAARLNLLKAIAYE